ncbi:hypothetical protein MMC27_001482 [Xylographa pallens]|nr:hypothetical protein [Xylographa pallens]
MYMTPAIAVAILAFVVGIQAQPLIYDDAAIIERSAQPEAYADAFANAEAEAYAYAYADAEAEAYADPYAEAELEARMPVHKGDFVKGALLGVAGNAVANHYGVGTSNLKAALAGGVANVAAHSEHVHNAGHQLSDAMHRLVQRDTEAIMYQLELQRRSYLQNAAGY